MDHLWTYSILSEEVNRLIDFLLLELLQTLIEVFPRQGREVHCAAHGLDRRVPREVCDEGVGSKAALLVDHIDLLVVLPVAPLVRGAINGELMHWYVAEHLAHFILHLCLRFISAHR